MTYSERRLRVLARRFPVLLDPNSWPELSAATQERLSHIMAREAPYLVTAEDWERSQEVKAAAGTGRTKSDVAPWSARFLRLLRVGTAACIVPPTLFIPSDWPGKHLVLYAIASAYTFGIAVTLFSRRAWGSCIAAACLGLFATVDCVAWLRIYSRVDALEFPLQLAVLDVLAYFSIVVSAAALMRRTHEHLDAPPSRFVFVFFTIYCYVACIYWHLLSTTLKDSPLANTLREVWGLQGVASSFGFAGVEGLRFMSWLVWALYGISGTISLYLMARRHSLRATVRWLLVPCSVYACMGPWIAESWQWFRYAFLLLPLAALADWLLMRRRRQNRD